MRQPIRAVTKWLAPGLRIKRWLFLVLFGITVLAIGMAQIIFMLYHTSNHLPTLLSLLTLRFIPVWTRVLLSAILGFGAIFIGFYELNRSILAPFALRSGESFWDAVYDARTRRQSNLKVTALGGGTGLPSVLRGLKQYTRNMTAVVTVADDGGSSGKLRRELGVLPPGDLRNNIAALANDEALMTQLFQYRFATGGLEGHSFGNLFLTALSEITGSMDKAIVEAEHVLAIEGRVLPSTLQENVELGAEVRLPGENRTRIVIGESQIPESGGKIERVFLQPDQVRAYPEAVRAILSADLLVIGPGSLFTSILPTLLVSGMIEAIRASSAYKVYVCNVATQEGETDGFTVADHVEVLETHIGQRVFQAVIGNNSYPTKNAGEKTRYVLPASESNTITRRYEFHYTDLTDEERPWRHDPNKLAKALLELYNRSINAASSGDTGTVK